MSYTGAVPVPQGLPGHLSIGEEGYEALCSLLDIATTQQKKDIVNVEAVKKCLSKKPDSLLALYGDPDARRDIWHYHFDLLPPADRRARGGAVPAAVGGRGEGDAALRDASGPAAADRLRRVPCAGRRRDGARSSVRGNAGVTRADHAGHRPSPSLRDRSTPDNVCSKGSAEPGRPRHSDNQPPWRCRLKLPLPGSQLASENEPLLVVVEDVNRALQPARFLERLAEWADAVAAERDRGRWQVLCPVWPRTIASVSENGRKSIGDSMMGLLRFTEEEGVAVVPSVPRAPAAYRVVDTRPTAGLPRHVRSLKPRLDSAETRRCAMLTGGWARTAPVSGPRYRPASVARDGARGGWRPLGVVRPLVQPRATAERAPVEHVPEAAGHLEDRQACTGNQVGPEATANEGVSEHIMAPAAAPA